MQTFDVYRALWRHKLFIVVLTGLLVGATWYFTSRETKVYQASTLVRIQQRIANAGEAFGALETGQRLAETYAQIVETEAVRRRIFALVREQLPVDNGTIGIAGHTVQQLELLRISARSSSPQNAALVANAAPEALRSFIHTTGTLRDQIVTIDRALVPKTPVAPRLKLNLAIALLLGLIFNGALAILIDVLSDHLPDDEELEGLLGLPVLASVPAVKLAGPPNGTAAELPALHVLAARVRAAQAASSRSERRG